MTNTQRTLKELRKRGFISEVVEKFIKTGTIGFRRDLFKIIDIISLDFEKGVMGVQSCGQDFKAHKDKILYEETENTYNWLRTPCTSLELWGWRKIKAKWGGKKMIWSVRIEEITFEDILKVMTR